MLPKKIDLGGYKIRVNEHNTDSIIGDSNLIDCRMSICQKLEEQMKRKVFWHELLHLITDYGGLKHNERLCTVFGNLFDEFMQKNLQSVINLYRKGDDK